MLRVNAFDWDAEFPKIMRGGGFDAVIGNPPYVRMELFKELKPYLRRNYACHAERSDLYVYFIEREQALLRRQGRMGMIVSNKFIRAKYGEPLRKHLADVAGIDRIVDLAGLPVFRGATVRTVVLLTNKEPQTSKTAAVRYSPPPTRSELVQVVAGTKTLGEIADPLAYQIPSRELRAGGWRLIRPECAALLDRLAKKSESLSRFVDGKICMGIKSGMIEAFVISPKQRRAIVSRNAEAKQIIRPFLQGRQIRRYGIDPVSEYLTHTHHGIDMRPYPAVLEHLRPFRGQLEQRATEQAWYELQQPQFAYVPLLDKPKLSLPDIATGCRFALDPDGRFGANTVYFIPSTDHALLGLLNSRLAFFFFKQTCAALEGPGEAYLRFFGQYLEGFPVRLANAAPRDKEKLAELVSQILAIDARRSAVTTDHHRTALDRNISAVDRQIDQLVYRIYDLTEGDIVLIEDSSALETEAETEAGDPDVSGDEEA